MRNLKVTLRYDGTNFFGWQRQPNRRTVQESLENAYFAVTSENVRTNVSGRTDAGVHALAQVVNFYTLSRHPTGVLQRAVNAGLPEDVQVTEIVDVPESFDANLDVRTKLYRYVICDDPLSNLFMRKYCCHCRTRLDEGAMQRASRCLVGHHDFSSFETAGSPRMSRVRTVTRLNINRMGCWLYIDVEADGFLYNMVRSIAGTLIDVGRGYMPEARVAEVLHAEDRKLAGPTAPAQGLFMVRVVYD